MEEEKEIFTIVTTKIADRWHARLMHTDGRIVDEMACENREDIGYICSVMLKWADRAGWPSRMAWESRRRKKPRINTGKIWYRNKLHDKKEN